MTCWLGYELSCEKRRRILSALLDWAYFQGGELEAVLYPNALLLRGPSGAAARAHALVVEALTGHPNMFQTASAEAQEIERQIHLVWSRYRLHPQAHAIAMLLMSRFNDIATEIARRP